MPGRPSLSVVVAGLVAPWNDAAHWSFGTMPQCINDFLTVLAEWRSCS